RANRTVTQMLRQCVNDKQTDWVAKLPAIEFAINSARSHSTSYAPASILPQHRTYASLHDLGLSRQI
ncbi:hypothetical protein HYPSUDRAFT_151846, partial [Hypholoma sublateritium FD-334 SS-4]